MLQSYTKKPVTIHAIQWDGTTESAHTIRSLLGEGIEVGETSPSGEIDPSGSRLEVRSPHPFLRISTPEGVMSATAGDYIIRGIAGEIYPCKPAIFEASYASAEPAPRAAMVSNAPQALNLLLESYKIRRAGWRNKFCLGLGITQYPASDPPILRIPDDGSPPMPWTPTEDDLFANDWLNNSGLALEGSLGENDVSAICIEEGEFSWALAEIQAGRSVFIGNSPLKLSLGFYTMNLSIGFVTLEKEQRPCIKLTLPNGQTRIWRPQHQDLWGSYTAVHE